MPAGLDLVRILLVEVAQLHDLGLPIERVAIEVHLGVERHQVAVFGDHQRIDLDQAGVELGKGLADAAHERDRLADLPAVSSPRPNAIWRPWKGWNPIAGSIATLMIFSGVLAATSSMSTPPSVEAMRVSREAARSISAAR